MNCLKAAQRQWSPEPKPNGPWTAKNILSASFPMNCLKAAPRPCSSKPKPNGPGTPKNILSANLLMKFERPDEHNGAPNQSQMDPEPKNILSYMPHRERGAPNQSQMDRGFKTYSICESSKPNGPQSQKILYLLVFPLSIKGQAQRQWSPKPMPNGPQSQKIFYLLVFQ